MCGRGAQFLTLEEARNFFQVPLEAPSPNIPARYNAAPGQDLAVVRWNAEAGRRQIDLLRWGLVPAWAKEPKVGYAMINAMAETVASKPAYRGAFGKGRRCLVPFNGFYEWKAEPDGKQPVYFSHRDGSPLALAGLWEGWREPGSDRWLRTFTIVTTEPNSLCARVHSRMPVILPPEAWPAWLGETPVGAAELQALLRPYPAERLQAWPVSRRVNASKNEGADLVEAVRPVA